MADRVQEEAQTRTPDRSVDHDSDHRSVQGLTDFARNILRPVGLTDSDIAEAEGVAESLAHQFAAALWQGSEAFQDRDRLGFWYSWIKAEGSFQKEAALYNLWVKWVETKTPSAARQGRLDYAFSIVRKAGFDVHKRMHASCVKKAKKAIQRVLQETDPQMASMIEQDYRYACSRAIGGDLDPYDNPYADAAARETALESFLEGLKYKSHQSH